MKEVNFLFEKNITLPSPIDFGRRNIHNFVFTISNLKSDVYIQTLDDSRINAKSILGLLSINISKDTHMKISVYNKNEEMVTRDLDLVLDGLKRVSSYTE